MKLQVKVSGSNLSTVTPTVTGYTDFQQQNSFINVLNRNGLNNWINMVEMDNEDNDDSKSIYRKL